MKEGREKEESERGWICTWGLRELKSPHQGNQLGQRGSTWSCQRVKQLICDTLNGVRTTQTIHVVALRTLDSDTSHCWQQECREWRAIPGRGLLLTMGWWPEGMGERKLWRGMPLEGSLAAIQAGRDCWVTCRGYSHHCRLSLPTCWCQQLTNRERPTERVALWMPAAPSNREGPAREALWMPATRD